ncbi:MAG: adenylate/guanylate cyclase domain-containing protein [Elusimicrobia bacterium]|nr:adenylate/guanylate cyclase domain-containing protein [Elusimicrobiota bacterium]
MPTVARVAAGASEDRLEKLIAARLEAGSDQEAIDRRIWDLFGETWTVMFTDLAGFSRDVVEFGIIHFLQTIHESLRLLVPVVEAHDGILLKTEGDSLLVIFRNPDRALDCAREMQRACADYNRSRPATEKILLCVGLGYGRMLRISDHDVFGAEVNAASKLGEELAEAGDILVTGSLRKALGKRRGLSFQRLKKAPSGAKAAFRVSAS